MRKLDLTAADEATLWSITKENPCTLASVAILLAWREGLTRGEIRALQWRDIDLEGMTLRAHERNVPVEADVAELLRRCRETAAPDPDSYVANKGGAQVSEARLNVSARTALDDAGLAAVSLRDLRADFVHRMFAEHDAAYAMRVTGLSLSSYQHTYKKSYSNAPQRPKSTPTADDRLWDIMQRHREGSAGIALWLTQAAGLTEKEAVELTWDQFDGAHGVLHLARGDVLLIKELITILYNEENARSPTDDPHILLSPRARKPMNVSQLSTMLRQLLIREGAGGGSIADFRQGARAEGQRSRILSEAERRGSISRAETEALLDVRRATAAARLTELTESGALVRSGRRYLPADRGVPREKWRRAVCDYIRQRDGARIIEIADLLRVSKSTAGRLLLQMAEDGALVYVPAQRKYRLNPANISKLQE